MSSDQQRAELHKTIWKVANDLRGAVDGWDFKQYVLGMLFYRFISENLADYLNEGERSAGQPDFDYASITDDKAEFGRSVTVAEKGFYMLPSELFVNVRKKAKSDPDLNETLDRVFKSIEASAVGSASESDLKGLFDDMNVNSPKLGNSVAERNDRLTKLLDAVGDLDFGTFAENRIDAFGDAYEYLMTMYASGAGKSGGEFFTPQEVANLLARITLVGKSQVNRVYDPACGSGSLLLQFAKVLGKENVLQGFYGQEINLTTYNLCRINMFLHDVNYEKFDIALGDTLKYPKHWEDEPFDAIVSNPPYSIKWEGDNNPLLINDPRFEPAGVLAPKSFADLAFTLHMLKWLSVDGTAAIVEFPGALYRGGAEKKIRKFLVDNNFVEAVIQLPDNMFYGSTISTCILVLKKSKTENKTMFIDASKEFTKAGKFKVMQEAHRLKVLDAYTSRNDREYFARLVDNSEIADKDYNLSVETYISKEDTREVIEITELNAVIESIVARQADLRISIEAVIRDLEGSRSSRLDDLISDLCPNGVETKRLDEIATLFRGRGLAKKDIGTGEVPIILYGELYTTYGDYVSEVVSKASPDRAKLGTSLRRGDILMPVTSTTKDAAIGKASALLVDESVFLGGDAIALRHNQEPGYLVHLLNSSKFEVQKMKHRSGTTVSHLSPSGLMGLEIPLPPIELQRMIVQILDQFTDLAELLEVELNSRRKQFRYFQDKVLALSEAPE